MRSATKVLSDEHKNILKMIELLQAKVSGWNKEDVRKAIEFIRNYADKFHHAKEEDILFKEFGKSENIHCNPVEQMLFEHEQGRGFVKAIEEANEAGDKRKLEENAKNYAELLQQHIFKEDNILYPMTEDAIKDKKAMINQFKKTDKEKKKIREKCLKILKELEK